MTSCGHITIRVLCLIQQTPKQWIFFLLFWKDILPTELIIEHFRDRYGDHIPKQPVMRYLIKLHKNTNIETEYAKIWKLNTKS